jgi:hypothetical protein
LTTEAALVWPQSKPQSRNISKRDKFIALPQTTALLPLASGLSTPGNTATERKRLASALRQRKIISFARYLSKVCNVPRRRAVRQNGMEAPGTLRSMPKNTDSQTDSFLVAYSAEKDLREL